MREKHLQNVSRRHDANDFRTHLKNVEHFGHLCEHETPMAAGLKIAEHKRQHLQLAAVVFNQPRLGKLHHRVDVRLLVGGGAHFVQMAKVRGVQPLFVQLIPFADRVEKRPLQRLRENAGHEDAEAEERRMAVRVVAARARARLLTLLPPSRRTR